MARGKKHSPKQIVSLLRQIEVAVANGKTTGLACKEASITEQMYYLWQKECGGLQVDQARRLKGLYICRSQTAFFWRIGPWLSTSAICWTARRRVSSISCSELSKRTEHSRSVYLSRTESTNTKRSKSPSMRTLASRPYRKLLLERVWSVAEDNTLPSDPRGPQ